MKNPAESTFPNQEEWVAVSKIFSTEGIHNLESHGASFITHAVRSYTNRMSLSLLGTKNKVFRLRTVPLVMYHLFHNFYVFFLTISNLKFSAGTRCFLINRGSFSFKKISLPSLHSCLMSFGHLQDSMLDPSSKYQNEDLPTRIRASTPAARSLSLSDYLSLTYLSTEWPWVNFM